MSPRPCRRLHSIAGGFLFLFAFLQGSSRDLSRMVSPSCRQLRHVSQPVAAPRAQCRLTLVRSGYSSAAGRSTQRFQCFCAPAGA